MYMLAMTTLTGDDSLVAPRLSQLATALGDNVESLDMAHDDPSRLVDLVGSASLFTPVRLAIVKNLTPEALDVLESYAESSSAEVIVTSQLRMTAKLVSRLEALGALERLQVPSKPAERAALITQMAAARSINITNTDALMLADRLAENFERVGSVLTQLVVADIGTPTSKQLSTLAGSAAPEVTPWAITDAAAKGDVTTVLNLAAKSDPIFVATFLVAETLRLARVKEANLTESQAAKELGIHPFRAKKLVAWAKRVPLNELHQAVVCAARVDIAAKSDHASDRLVLAVANWLAVVRPR